MVLSLSTEEISGHRKTSKPLYILKIWNNKPIRSFSHSLDITKGRLSRRNI